MANALTLLLVGMLFDSVFCAVYITNMLILFSCICYISIVSTCIYFQREKVTVLLWQAVCVDLPVKIATAVTNFESHHRWYVRLVHRTSSSSNSSVK